MKSKSRIKRVVSALVLLTFVVGCGGRAANPVMIQKYGDDKKSCKSLEMELSQIENEIQQLMPKTQKAGKNIVLGVAGAFFLVPWFFMDLSQAEQMEVNAFRQRHNHLLIISSEKECGIEKEAIPDFTKKPDKEGEESL